MTTPRRLPGIVAAAACLLFVAAGLPFVPLAGIQNDEALFAYGVFRPRSGVDMMHLGRFDLALMLMSYVGALKAWIYLPLFGLLGANVWTTRVPMLAVGAASIWLCYLFLRDAASERAAIAGCLLLAADPIYLLTTTFDWGPVALQHLLAMGCLVSLLRFWRRREEWSLAAGFLLAGLMMWDKALAIWSLSGLGLAGLITQWRQIGGILTPRRVAVALGAFAVGALPLIAYNLKMNANTIHQTAAYDGAHLADKLRVLGATAEGSGLFGWLNSEDSQACRPQHPRGLEQRVSAAIAPITGNPRQSWMLYVFGAALLLAPLSRGAERRVLIFATLSLAVAWLLMAITANGGGSMHHTILLWPLPQIAAGASLSAASRRLGRWGKPALAFVLLASVGSNLAVLNTYYLALVRNRGAINWTDAIFPLSESLKKLSGHEFYCVDWGLMGSLHLLNRGKLKLLVGSDELSRPAWTAEDRSHLKAMVSDPDHFFLTHVPGFEFFAGFTERLAAFGGGLGYRRETLSIVNDSCGRPTFEVYHFVAAAEAVRPLP